MFGRQQKKDDHISRTEPGFEEGERKTPWTGTLLLIIMFIAGLVFGWRAVDDLASVPARPQDLLSCSAMYVPATYHGPLVPPSPMTEPVPPPGVAKDFSTPPEEACPWSDLETQAGIPALETERQSILHALNEGESSLRDDYTRATQKAQSLEEQYNLHLQEMQAGAPTITPQALADLQTQVNDALNAQNQLSQQLDQKIASDQANSADLKDIESKIRAAYASVFATQEYRERIFEFKVFLLQIIFILPAFLIALWLYLRQLKKNSPYAIILTAIVGVTGVLVLRVLLAWFWDLFLAEVIQDIWRWIQNFELLRSLVFYLGMVLSFVIFGGAVYYLQKRIFDPRRVAIRRFRLNQCPRCQTTLDLASEYCPNCGHHVREQCPSCNQPRFVELPYCPHCGHKK